MTSYRMKQTERGLEAVKLLADFLETKNGVLTVSIHESNFSSGTHSQPDIVFGAYGIEVKRVEFLCKHRFNHKEEKGFYAHMGHLSILHESWDRLKQWCAQHFKVPLVVAVLTFGRQSPIFVKLSQKQVDELQQQQVHKKWFQLNSWELLVKGEIWT